MKKIIFILLGLSLLLSACKKGELAKIDQIPYRQVIEYDCLSFEMDVPGEISPDATYQWISFTQNGNKVTFTVSRNTTTSIRHAEYTIAGSSYKVVINQKAHSLDAKQTISVPSRTPVKANMRLNLSTDHAADYNEWGLIVSKDTSMVPFVTQKDDKSDTVWKVYPKSYPDNFADKKPGNGAPKKGDNDLEVPVDKDTPYFVWSYVISTEKDTLVDFENYFRLIPPICITADNVDKLQDLVKEEKSRGAEIRFASDCALSSLEINENFGGRIISGGWVSDFAEIDSTSYTKIGTSGITVSTTEDDGPMYGNVNLSCFEITGCDAEGILVNGGPVYIHDCDIHDNKVGIATVKNSSSIVYIYNNKIADNTDNNVKIEDGVENHKVTADYTQATIVNNLISGASMGIDGAVDAMVVNNTFVGDNWKLVVEEDAKLLFANNILSSQSAVVEFGKSYATFVGNLYTNKVELKSDDNISRKVDDKESNKQADGIIDSSYYPTGDAIGFGYLGEVSYKSKEIKDGTKVKISDILKTYDKDLAGKKRVVKVGDDDKVDAGCYQKQ